MKDRMKKNLKIWPALLLAAGLLAVTAAAEPVKAKNEDEFMNAIGKANCNNKLSIFRVRGSSI